MQFIDAFGVGGTERHFTGLLRSHDRTRFEPFVGCISATGGLYEELNDLKEMVTEYPIRRLYGPRTWSQQLRLARYLRANRIDVLHSYGFYGNCFAIPAARLAKVPAIVASVRSGAASWTPNQRRVERWICKSATSVLTNAQSVKDRLAADGWAAEKIAVIPNGIDTTLYAAAARTSGLRTEFGIPADAPLIGSVARLHPDKGLEYFLEAAVSISHTVPGAWFVIVGDAYPDSVHQAYRRSLEEGARRLGLGDRLVFAGTRDDIPAVLRELDVSVLPSLTEGLPNSVLESMAAGVPVVATNVGGIPEIIDDEVTGVLIPPRDAEALAAAVGRLYSVPELALQLSSNARRAVEERFSRAKMARATEEHYLSLLR